MAYDLEHEAFSGGFPVPGKLGQAVIVNGRRVSDEILVAVLPVFLAREFEIEEQDRSRGPGFSGRGFAECERYAVECAWGCVDRVMGRRYERIVAADEAAKGATGLVRPDA